jgi:hypothetical protein
MQPLERLQPLLSTTRAFFCKIPRMAPGETPGFTVGRTFYEAHCTVNAIGSP